MKRPCDHYFLHPLDHCLPWVCAGATSTGGTSAMKAGKLPGHAIQEISTSRPRRLPLRRRWLDGKALFGNVVAEGYFTSEAQDDPRCMYNRTRTIGKSAPTIDERGQDATPRPPILCSRRTPPPIFPPLNGHVHYESDYQLLWNVHVDPTPTFLASSRSHIP